jgi:hypothetical protein
MKTRTLFGIKIGAPLTATVAAVGLVLAGGGVYSLLNATAFNTTAQTVTSGTLKLELANNGVGFSTNISNIAPTDVVNRYVSLTNSGTLAAVDQTLTVSATGSTLLTTSAVKGLAATVDKCSVAWTPGTGVCSGTTTNLVPSTPLATLIGSPATLQATVAAGNVLNLKISVTLPDQNETTTNGTLPVGTIQGLSTDITWTFDEEQRAGITTNS